MVSPAQLSAMHSSERMDWATPLSKFKEWDAEFGFTLDVCATPENAKCARFITPEQDALSQKWEGVCWMNPPYGREIGKWVRKAYESAQEGAMVVCLVPSRTCSTWWHEWAMTADIRFLRGRIKFDGHKHNAPFPSALLIFTPTPESEAPNEQ